MCHNNGTSTCYFRDMKPFLKQVAEHYFSLGHMEDTCFVFPNRRSLVFFRKYLGETLAATGDVPMIVPGALTMNDLFFRASGMKQTGRVVLLLELYESYKQVRVSPEPLDEFIFWGDVLLSDFDDVDKYLVDARGLFTNVSDFKGMQDHLSYLTERQREAIEHLLSHFREGDSLKPGLGADGTDVKSRFLQIWDLLLPLYTSFNERLADAGLAYEGKAYRSLATRLREEAVTDVMGEAFPGVKQFVFVGLNALNECERLLLRRLRDAHSGEFCWDYCSGAIRDPRNKASLFMEANVAEFPQAFDLEQVIGWPEIKAVSVPSAVGQVKQLPGILSGIADGSYGGDLSRLGTDTAVVLPDETLLPHLLNTIPPEISDINVTMGSPMTGSALFTLMNDILAMQLHLRRRDGEWYFYHRQVWSVCANGLFRAALSETGRQIVAKVKSGFRYYIPQSDFSGDPLLETVFRAVVTDPTVASADTVRALEDYQQTVIALIASAVREDPAMLLELDFSREYYLAVGSLRQRDLPILPVTYSRLMVQLVGSSTVPFKGEPLRGLQVMGPLETRALDFRHLVVMSCNEGLFPRRSVSSSFVPPELRAAFGLPTYDYQDAVWAYYFYRMIQRAETVWLLYDSRTEALKSGEESRYIKQLELHFGVDVQRFVAKASLLSSEEEPPIEKTEEHVKTIRETFLSASSLQNYLACPAKFYYYTVCKLKAEDGVSESLDAGMIGNVYHGTMHALYFGPVAMAPDFDMSDAALRAHKMQKSVTREYISEWLGRPEDIRARIRSLICKELHAFEVTGRNLVFEGVVLKYVLKTLERDLELIERSGTQSFEVLGLELKRFWEHDGFKFIGYIDRMDSVREGELRIVDYKTGRVTDEDILISDDNARTVVDALFGEDNSKRPKIALQLFLYDMFVDRDAGGRRIVNSIYSPARLFVSGVQNVGLSGVFIDLMKERLSDLLKEIADTSIPFSRTSDKKTCQYCDFKTICGR